jgi:hypothetical protein
MIIEIKHRWTDTCLWSGEVADQGRTAENIGAAVKGALATGANLTGANLRGANLTRTNLRDANLRDANLRDANLRDANLTGADLTGADLRDADLTDANLRDANLTRTNLTDANLRDANLTGGEIQALRAFAGLYQYQIWAYVIADGTPCVRMGCLYKTVPEWDSAIIRESNTSEFPNDGSTRCEQRARAFEFARAEALIMAAECVAKA